MARKHHAPYVPTDEDGALLGVLGGGAILRTPRGTFGVPATGAPHGAVFELIQAVYEAFPGQAHAMLRHRILSAEAPTALDRDVVRVAAKRLTGPVIVRPGEGTVTDVSAWARRARRRARLRSVVVPELEDDWTGWISACAAASAPGRRALAERDRPVFAALLARDGTVLRVARNTAGRNRTLHAEVNLVQGWFAVTRRGLPDGATVVTSLQPCRMCAALLAHGAEGRLAVHYAHPDPGPFARQTALQRGGPVFELHVPPMRHTTG